MADATLADLRDGGCDIHPTHEVIQLTTIEMHMARAEIDADPGHASTRSLTKRDFLLGTLIATTMAIGFSRASHGWSLIVTFVPGVVGAWFLFAWYRRRQIELPPVESFLPAFAVVLAVEPGEGQRAVGALLPWIGEMAMIDGRATAYVCRDFVCAAPVTDPEALV